MENEMILLDQGELSAEEMELIAGGTNATYWAWVTAGGTVGTWAMKLGGGPVALAGGLAAGSVLGCYFGIKEDLAAMPKRKK